MLTRRRAGTPLAAGCRWSSGTGRGGVAPDQSANHKGLLERRLKDEEQSWSLQLRLGKEALGPPMTVYVARGAGPVGLRAAVEAGTPGSLFHIKFNPYVTLYSVAIIWRSPAPAERAGPF